MKKLLFICFLPVLTLLVYASPQIWNATLTPAVTNITAATTNSTAGVSKELIISQRPMRIFMKCNGTTDTTAGSLVVKFSTASDSNVWDTAASSNIKLTMSTLGASTNVVSDWFETAGVKYIRVGQIENTFGGPVSNLVIWISSPRE